uniref:Ras-related protein Rab n=1 Tax=Parascaris univalens TaxID=6257 RepID=A0A915BQL7_PARUN
MAPPQPTTSSTQKSVTEKQLLFKILIIGDVGTGKSSIVRRYVHNLFNQYYKATVGVDFAMKVLVWDMDTLLRLQIWDISGIQPEQFISCYKNYGSNTWQLYSKCFPRKCFAAKASMHSVYTTFSHINHSTTHHSPFPAFLITPGTYKMRSFFTFRKSSSLSG